MNIENDMVLMVVSIPYRFNESGEQSRTIAIILVSIPYRFNESIIVHRIDISHIMFQFLIGSMKVWIR